MTDTTSQEFHYQIQPHQAGQRLDQVAAGAFAGFSRARLQGWIKSGQLTIDGRAAKPKDKVYGTEQLYLQVRLEPEQRWQGQNIHFDEVYTDDHIIVVNKSPGLVVHPGAGVADSTLLNGLLFRYPQLDAIPRAGIVHRLDKDTSGLMVVARSLPAHHSLVKQLQDRSLAREYEAIVMGQMTGGGVVDKPMGRHPVNRLKMAVLENKAEAKDAITHYRLIKRYARYTHIACQLESGRTHQIRVHMAYLKHPLVGDPLYLGRKPWLAGTSAALKAELAGFSRQALHAKKLSLIHPGTAEPMSWQVDTPDDMQNLLNHLDKEPIA
ncbi:MAG: 23S rRNA pseudouridine(1911/1915/1917) synthase RluD [Pseudomonadota bacterium]